VQVMETWRQELIGSLARELEDSDYKFQEQLAVDLGTQVSRVCTAPTAKRGRGGSHFSCKFIQRDRRTAHERLVADYFAPQPVYDGSIFRHRYRMRRELFLRIVSSVYEFDSYFVQSADVVGQLGLSSLQKCTAALKMLAYGAAADATDEYCRLGESTALESMKQFVNAVRGCFEAEYLWGPTRADLERQVIINSARGFPGMFGSLDCMHWDWEKRPTAWQGQFQDKNKNRNIILEAIANQSLWIWHTFFGLPGGNNDINVLDRSPLVGDFLRDESTDMTFVVNGHTYHHYYLLIDSIYPQ
jgi:hypothetical protein